MALRILATALLVVVGGFVSAQERQPNSAIRGRVVDVSGNVMPGVGLIARPAQGGPLVRLTTRAGGQYEISGLAQGDYDVFAFLGGFDTGRLINARVRNTPFELDFRLQAGTKLECVYVPEPPFGTIEGVVTDPKGFPLPFAIVEVKQLSGTRIYRGRYLQALGYADENGRYSANVPSGHHQVTATYPGYAAGARDVSVLVGRKVDLPLLTAAAVGRGTSVESLHSFTNCGKLGFRNPAPAPRLR